MGSALHDARIPAPLRRRLWPFDHRHAVAILAGDFPAQWADVGEVLSTFAVLESEMLRAGGNKGPIASRLESAFGRLGWSRQQLTTNSGITHEIDSFKDRVALEVEWNSKDSVYDRDLDVFRTLYLEGKIDVAMIITRSASLKGVYGDDRLRDADGPIKRKYGESTTHFGKLRGKIERGGSGGCPVLVFSISPHAVEYDITGRDSSEIPVDPRDSSGTTPG
jgi:hypothetical protein